MEQSNTVRRPVHPGTGYTAGLVSVLVVLSVMVFHFGFSRPFHSPKYLVLGVLILFLIRGGKNAYPPSLLAILVLLWPLISGIWSLDPLLYFSAMAPLALLAMAISTVIRPDQRRAIERGMVWSVVPVVAYLAVQRIGWDPIAFVEAEAAGGFFGNTNFSAHYLVLVLALFGRNRKWVIFGCFLGLALTGSRGAWLAALIWVGVESNIWISRCDRRFLVGFCLIVVLMIIVGAWRFSHDIVPGIGYITNPRAYVAQYQELLPEIRQAESRVNDPDAYADIDPWFHGKRRSIITRVLLSANSIVPAWKHILAGGGLGQFHIIYPRYAQSMVPDIHMSDRFRARSSHNLVLDGVITLGLPWLILFFWYLKSWWQRADPSWRVALGLQLGIAMVSLNYVNPLIPVMLVLLRPKPETPPRQPQRLGPVLLFWFWLAVLVFSVWLDFQAARRAPLPTLLFPAKHAAAAYADGRLQEAWSYQLRALHYDPYGPETLFNLGQIADYLGSQGNANYQSLALIIWEVNVAMHPFYAPAEEKWHDHALPGQVIRSDPYIAHQELMDYLEDFPSTDAGNL